MKKAYRKVVDFLLLGVACLVAGCQSLSIPGFKKPTFLVECGWLEVPYSFRCDYIIATERLGPNKPEEGLETSPAPLGDSLPRESL